MMAKADLKSPEEIQMIAEGGKKLRQVLDETVAAVTVGMKLEEIEQFVWKKLEATGGKPAFAQVPGYRWATCINVNEGIVHGIPSQRVVKLGDVVTIDMGLFFRGFNTDTATTFQVSHQGFLPVQLDSGETVDQEAVEQFLKTGEQALKEAIAQARPGNRVGHISEAIQTTIKAKGYTPSLSLVGHGVGRALHEFPPIPCFLDGPTQATPLLKSGMTLAIEVIYSMGKALTETEADSWTIRMKDGKIAAVFEKTIAVTDDGPFVCT
jgi:methionyl aminopeptidase